MKARPALLAILPAAFLLLAHLSEAVAVEEFEEVETPDPVRDLVGKLVLLQWEKQGIRLDHAYWSTPFRGKSLGQIEAEYRAALFRELDPTVGETVIARMASRFMAGCDLEKLVELSLPICTGSASRARHLVKFTRAAGDLSVSARLEMTGETVAAASIHRLHIEIGSYPCQITLEDDGEGEFTLTAWVRPSGERVVLHQLPSGRASAVMAGGKHPTAFTGDSFADLYRKHPEIGKTLFPRLRTMGINLPLEPSSPEVAQRALVRLRPTEAPDLEQCRALIQQLDDNVFEKREKATTLLSEGYDRWKDLLKEAETGQGSLEQKTRLQAIREERAKAPPGGMADACIDAFHLLEDPAFLTGLMAQAGEADRAAITARLAILKTP